MGLKDDYLNWFPIEVDSGADSTTLTSNDENTNASAATKIGWRIHLIEFYMDVGGSTVDEANLTLGLSTRKGLSAMPALTDVGCIALCRMDEGIVTSGYNYHISPIVFNYLPPVLIAGSNISMYFQGSTNNATWQSKTFRARIGYTMIDIAGDAWQELFQTWNFSS